MFFGEFEYTVDDKGRLTIPAKFKDELATGVVVTRGLDGCLWAFTKEGWQEWAKKIADMPMGNEDARRFKRFMFSSASESIPDRNGRVIIPQKLRDYAGIESGVVITGAMDKIEIWNPEKWAGEQDLATKDPEALATQLDKLGIL